MKPNNTLNMWSSRAQLVRLLLCNPKVLGSVLGSVWEFIELRSIIGMIVSWCWKLTRNLSAQIQAKCRPEVWPELGLNDPIHSTGRRVSGRMILGQFRAESFRVIFGPKCGPNSGQSPSGQKIAEPQKIWWGEGGGGSAFSIMSQSNPWLISVE